MTLKENVKLNIWLIGREIVVVFVLSHSKLVQRRTMETRKYVEKKTRMS